MPLAQMILFGVFFSLVGACVGSFLNVVIWRLPHRGHEVTYLKKTGKMTLSWPPSHCPMCDTPIQWYQNLPILSYVALRGRCAKCRVSIPIRYPLVELATMLLWSGLFLAYFVAHWQAVPYKWQNGAGISNLATDWPPYVWHCVFASALLAASAIDADLFIIPLAITWFLGILGVIGSALIGTPLTHDFAMVPSLTPGAWWMAKPILGMAVGLVLANVLLMLGVLPRSFPWEFDPPPPKEDEKKDNAKDESLAPPPKLTKFGLSVAASVVLVVVMAALWIVGSYAAAAVVTLAGAILIFLIGVLPRDAGQTDVTDEVVGEISQGNVRLEILKEVLFLIVPLTVASIFYMMPLEVPQIPWVSRVFGSLFGLLVGGGIVWLIRIGGSFGFNKQAMGIGDVHLMAGVGAVIGAPLVLFAFFTAPFAGILWALVLKILGKPNVLPYGPWLSVASIVALLVGNPTIQFYLKMMSLP